MSKEKKETTGQRDNSPFAKGTSNLIVRIVGPQAAVPKNTVRKSQMLALGKKGRSQPIFSPRDRKEKRQGPRSPKETRKKKKQAG